MKKLKIIAGIFLLLILSCSKPDIEKNLTEESLTALETEIEGSNPSSMVDPNTPEGVQPFSSYELENKSSRSTNKSNNLPAVRIPNTEWYCVWSDEFNGKSLNRNKWTARDRVGSKSRWCSSDGCSGEKSGNSTKVFYDWDRNKVSVRNGSLILKNEKVANNRIKSGSVWTKDANEFWKYGYFEAKIQVSDTRQGPYTAFWLNHPGMANRDLSYSGAKGKNGAEIDIFESTYDNGTSVYSNVHTRGYGQYHKSSERKWNINSGTRKLYDGGSNYNTYALHWSENQYKIYFNRTKKTTHKGESWVSREKQYMLLSCELAFFNNGKEFVSQPIGNLKSALIDYVRIFKLKPKEDTYFTLLNKKTRTRLKTYGNSNGSYIKQTSSSTGGWTKWKVQKVSASSKYYYIKNQSDNKHIKPISSSNYAKIKLESSSSGGSWTQWEFIDATSDGYFYIRNKQTGKYLRPKSSAKNDYTVVATKNDSDWFKWKLE